MIKGQFQRPAGRLVLTILVIALILTGSAWAQQAQQTTAAGATKDGPVVRTFGTAGGYRTEVTSQTRGTLSQEDRRQVSLLMAQVFQHVDEARRAVDAADVKRARQEVHKGGQALRVIRDLLPRTTVHTKTTAPDGKVVYEDDREVQESRISLFEGMLQARTFAPILAAKKEQESEADDVAGIQVIESEAVTTEVIADLNLIEAQLHRAVKALEDNKPEEASKALAWAQVQGVGFHSHREDTPLAEARDAIWLAKRALEENNTVQARANLNIARRQLEVYRQVLPEDQRKDVTQMLTEVSQLEAILRQEANQAQPASHAERTSQGNSAARWWDQVNSWFKKRH
jgi:flagellin-specific chaperone FliS